MTAAALSEVARLLQAAAPGCLSADNARLARVALGALSPWAEVGEREPLATVAVVAALFSLGEDLRAVRDAIDGLARAVEAQ